MTNPYNGDIDNERTDGNLGVSLATGGDVIAVLACAPKGPMFSTKAYSDKDRPAEVHGVCEGTEFAAAFIRRTGNPAMLIRMPTATPGAIMHVDTDGVTGSAPVTMTGTPTDGLHMIYEVLQGGVVGTIGIILRYSRDGGTEWSGSYPLGTANNFTADDSGLLLSLGAGDLKKGDRIIVLCAPPRWTSSDIELAFSALKAQSSQVRVVHLIGPASKTDLDDLAAAADDYKKSKGRDIFCFASYRLDRRIPVRMTGDPDLTFTASTGIITRATGDFEAEGFHPGMLYAANGTGSNDGGAYITAVTPSTLTTDGTLTDEGPVDGVTLTAYEPEEDYVLAWRSALDQLVSPRLGVSAGGVRHNSSLTKGTYRRPTSWPAAIRVYERSYHEALGNVDNGQLSDCSIVNEHGTLVEIDSELLTGLSSLSGANGRAITARRHDGYPGCYIDVPSTMHAPGSDYSRVHLSLISDELCTLLQRVLRRMIQSDFEPAPDGTLAGSSGDLIERVMAREIETEMVDTGKVASFTPTVSRTTKIVPGVLLPVSGYVQPRIYLEGFHLKTGLRVPKAA